MMPPICHTCGRDASKGGDLVCFAKRDSDLEWDRRMDEARGFTGHPPYAVWFCRKHLAKAQALAHLTVDEALGKL
jgi:hypothetical protein